MKKSVWVFIALSASFISQAQQTTVPAVPPPNPPASTPPVQRPATIPPSRVFDLTNTTQNPALATNAIPSAAATTNALVQTNLTPTGIPAFEQTTAIPNASTQSVNFSITNTLGKMAPAQATNVIQVQNGLTILQTIATTIGRVQNVQQAIQTPQIQQQVQQVSTQIGALAQGSIKPSQEITQRLAQDLLRAFGPVRLGPDRLLVLAIVLDHTFNSGSLSTGQIDDTINTGMATLQTAGVPLALAHPVSCDLHSVAFELQPSLAR